MPSIPLVSVVMGVHNNADQLPQSIQSILNQSFTDFEFIIINDGSSDHSQRVLEKLAQTDSRIKLLHQDNNGLTKSLITGCELARGKYIARQDVGDFSQPQRFQKQINYFKENNECGLVFCDFKTVDSLGNEICENRPSLHQINNALKIENGELAAPGHHGSAMFTKTCYLNAGGYREQFYFTQDLDLWVRMSEQADFHVIEEVLYHCLIAVDAISGKYHRLQKQYHAIIIESAQLRRQGKSEQAILEKAASIRPTSSNFFLGVEKSRTLYFMASCLHDRQPEQARMYLKNALSENPFNMKAWYKLLMHHCS